MEIREMVRLLAENGEEFYSVACAVKDINEQERTCTVTQINNGVDIFGVRLQATLNNNGGIYFIPQVGSNVIVTFIDRENAYLGMFDIVDKMFIEVGDSSLLIEDGKIEINGGVNGGLINIQELITQVDKNTAILDSIKNVLGTQVVEPGNGAPSALQIVLNTATSALQTADLSDIEDKTITH